MQIDPKFTALMWEEDDKLFYHCANKPTDTDSFLGIKQISINQTFNFLSPVKGTITDRFFSETDFYEFSCVYRQFQQIQQNSTRGNDIRNDHTTIPVLVTNVITDETFVIKVHNGTDTLDPAIPFDFEFVIEPKPVKSLEVTEQKKFEEVVGVDAIIARLQPLD